MHESVPLGYTLLAELSRKWEKTREGMEERAASTGGGAGGPTQGASCGGKKAPEHTRQEEKRGVGFTDAAALLRGVRKRLRRSSQGVDGGASVPVTTRGRLRPEYNLSGSAPKMLPHAGAAMPSTTKRRQCTGIAAAAAVMAGHIRHGAAARQANEQADTFLLQPGCQRPCATRERLTSRHRGAAASLPESTGSAHGQAMAISGSSQRREPSSSGR